MSVRRDTLPKLRRLPTHSCIVDSPRKIQFEKTSIGQPSELALNLSLFHDSVARVSATKIAKAAERTRILLEFLAPRLRVFAVKAGMRIVGTLNVGSAFDGTQTDVMRQTDVLMLFDSYGVRTDSADVTGYRVVPLRRYRAKSGSKVDEWRFGRSDCGGFLSPVATACSMHAAVERSLRQCTEAAVQPFESDSGCIVVLLNKGKQRLNVIPATYVERRDVYLVARPYMFDVHARSQLLWRLSYGHKESLVIGKMTSADRGTHAKALRVMKALFTAEHTLAGLTSYHLKTILLYRYDAVVDHDKRWQRTTLDACFSSLLALLLHSLTIKRLPHFFCEMYNLFDNIPPRALESLRTRVGYLALNKTEVIRILRKHSTKVVNTAR